MKALCIEALYVEPLCIEPLFRASCRALCRIGAVVLQRTQRRTQRRDKLKFKKSDDAVLLIAVDLVILAIMDSSKCCG